MLLLLSQFSFERFIVALLAAVIVVFLLTRKRRLVHTRDLALYFFFVFIFNLGHLVTYSIYSPAGAWGWYLAALAPFGLIFLMRFAYNFPAPRYKREARFVSAAALLLSAASYAEYVIKAAASPIVLSETGYAPRYVSPFIPPLALSFFFWVIVVALRQGLAAARDGTAAMSALRAVLSPPNLDSRRGRNLALLAVLELINTLLIVVYMSSKAFPYITLVTVTNAAFLVIYSGYVILYIRDSVQALPLKFRLTGIALVATLGIMGTMGNIALYQHENSYDERNAAQVPYLKTLVQKKDLSGIPTGIEYIIAAPVAPGAPQELIYGRDPDFRIPAAFRLWEFVPGSLSLGNGEERVGPFDPGVEEGARYFTQMDGVNYYHYRLSIDDRDYGIGYSHRDYRRGVHPIVLKFVIAVIVISLISLMLFPLLLYVGFIKPVENIAGDVKRILDESSTTGDEDELRYLSRSIDTIANTVQKSREISREYEELKRSAGKKRRDGDVTDQSRGKIMKALAYLDDNYRYDISREGLAEHVGMSPVRFGKGFKAVTGKKLGDYINELRIEKAKAMLTEGSDPIADIAFDVGFESMRTFYRSFIKLTGLTPSEFRSRGKNREK